MFESISQDWIKPIVLISLLIGSILFVNTTPVKITPGDTAVKELFYLEP